MAWTVTHNGDDVTAYASLQGMTLTAGAANGGRTINMRFVPGDSGFVPQRNADIVFLDEGLVRRWAGRIQSVERGDLGSVAGIANAFSYDAIVSDVGALMNQRLVPPARTVAERRARRLPPKGLESKYTGTFSPISSVRRIPIESALDWGLALIEDIEAANESGGLERLVPEIQVGNTTGALFDHPDYRGVGHEMTDLVRFPSAGATTTFTASTNAVNAELAADNDSGTAWVAASGANPYWRVDFSSEQIGTMVRIETGGTKNWADMRVELLDSGGGLINSRKVGAVTAGATVQFIWQGDAPDVRQLRVRDKSSDTGSGRGLKRVSFYETLAIYLSKEPKVKDRNGHMAIADAFSYSEVIDNICGMGQLGWYIDPGDEDGPILRTYSLTQPPMADFEIGDDPAQTPIAAETMLMARTIDLSESSETIVNRVVAQYGVLGSTKSVTVPDDVTTRRGLRAQAQVSQALYGLREKRLGDANIKTRREAMTLAQKELSRALGPEIAGSIRVPYDPAIRPGYRVRIHRGQHGPAIAPKDYYVATGFIKEVTWTFEDNGTEPYWCDLTIGDPQGFRVGFVEGLTGSLQKVARVASVRPSPIHFSSDDADAAEQVEWGTYSTYVVGTLQTAAWTQIKKAAYSRDYRTQSYQNTGLISTPSGRALFLPPVAGLHVDAAGRRNITGMVLPRLWGLNVPAAAGAIIRVRLFIPITRNYAQDYYVNELTARISHYKNFNTGYWGFADIATAPTAYKVTAYKGWVNATGGTYNLKSGTYASTMIDPELDQDFVELEITMPRGSLSGAGLNDMFWAAIGPSRLTETSAGMFTGGTGPTDSTVYPGFTVGTGSPGFSGSNFLWSPSAPVSPDAPDGLSPFLGFDPRDASEVETRGYAMIMVNTGAVLNATPGAYIERRIQFDGDKVKEVNLGQFFDPNSLVVFVNGQKYREERGHFEIVYQGEDAVGFNVSEGANPVRPLGLRNYTAKNGSSVRDEVIVRYRAA